jgi:hypothetical protein
MKSINFLPHETLELYDKFVINRDHKQLLLSALKLVLLLDLEKGTPHIQIYGDSMLIIQWIKGDFALVKLTLQPLFQDIMNHILGFSNITFEPVYKNRNIEYDWLSKVGP